jgi:hypothetical protein
MNFIFPYYWEKSSQLTFICLRGVETTNQSFFVAQSNQKKFRRETWRSGLWTIPYDDKIIVTWKKRTQITNEIVV